MGKYDDIIHLPHHQSQTHAHMPLSDRAAQFAPFAALNGYGAAIHETARLTEQKTELTESEKAFLDLRLQFLANCLAAHAEVRITYFQPDERKDGGKYVTVAGTVKKMDTHSRTLVLQSGQRISMDQISSIDSELFCDWEQEC